jgi:hypothetical protein
MEAIEQHLRQLFISIVDQRREVKIVSYPREIVDLVLANRVEMNIDRSVVSGHLNILHAEAKVGPRGASAFDMS